jgi:hypothetical protein
VVRETWGNRWTKRPVIERLRRLPVSAELVLAIIVFCLAPLIGVVFAIRQDTR